MQIFDAHTSEKVADETVVVRTDGTVVVERDEGGTITERPPSPEEEASRFRRDVLPALTALAADAGGQRVLSALVALELVPPRMARLAGWVPPARTRAR